MFALKQIRVPIVVSAKGKRLFAKIKNNDESLKILGIFCEFAIKKQEKTKNTMNATLERAIFNFEVFINTTTYSVIITQHTHYFNDKKFCLTLKVYIYIIITVTVEKYPHIKKQLPAVYHAENKKIKTSLVF